MKWTLRRRAGLLALMTFWSCGGDSPLGPEAPRADPNKPASEKPKPSAKPAVLVRVGLEQVDADKGAPLKGRRSGSSCTPPP
jgi:hypothetical protein